MGFDWLDESVLVTGATGMIGSFLVKELLGRGASVVALVKDADPQSELFRSGDVENCVVANGSLEDYASIENAINRNEVSSVFHLGAQTIVGAAHRNPLPTFDANIRGTYNLLEACRVHSGLLRRVVVASSDKAYGESATLPYVEEAPLAGKFPYEVSKSCADLLAQSYAHTYSLPVAIARCGNVYGGGDLNWSRIVPGTIRALVRGERPVIRSDGTFIRDYLYVKDVALAYVLLAESVGAETVPGSAFNFSAEKPLSVLEVVDALRRLMDQMEIEPEILDVAEGEIRDQYLDCGKARDALGWNTSYDLDAGLTETIAWYKSFFWERGAR